MTDEPVAEPKPISTEDDLKAALLAVLRRAATALDPPQMCGAMGEALAEYLEFLAGETLLPEEIDDDAT